MGFTGVFTLELLIKITGLGVQYFRDGANIFDFIITIGAVVGVVVEEFF